MKEKILNIISRVTRIDMVDLNNNMNREKLWNSLTHIEVIITLENELDIVFEIDELSELTSTSKIMEVVERKLIK